MKTFKHIFILVLAILVSFPVLAQVGIGTTEPDGTAMLDIQSTSKGILIPRMTTAQREAISSPATGLMVFDATTQSFWFYSSGWIELVTGGGSSAYDELEDDDHDTKVQVERTTNDNTIWFKTHDVDRMKITEDGILIVGDSISGNFTKITTDGSLSYVGDATRWDDMRFPVSDINTGTSNPPDWDLFYSGGGQGVWQPYFDKSTEEEVYFVAQMPHGWKIGSDIYPHVHWTLNVTGQESNQVKWALEYSWANVADNFPSPSTVSGYTVSVGDQSQYSHNITSLGAISGSGKTLSSILICRLYRDASDSNDTNTNDAALLEIDFHYQIDSDGSNGQFTKW